MDLFANDLSIQAQFHDLPTFCAAIGRLMTMRDVARRFGRTVYCHRNMVNTEPIAGVSMQRAIQALERDKRADLMVWLTRGGPFWEDDVIYRHGSDEYLEFQDKVVTDTAIGEAAYRSLHGNRCDLVSAIPSEWNFSPVEVVWRREDEGLEDQTARLENWRTPGLLEGALRDAASPLQSWDDLRNASESRFEKLTFARDCFKPLEGFPFADSTAKRCIELLDVLDRLADAFNAEGERTSEGHAIYQTYFTGEKAWFSDSSDTEKHDFHEKLTFSFPEYPAKSLPCPWHGKERHMNFRLHFSWPIRAGEPVYIVYFGPKLTKR